MVRKKKATSKPRGTDRRAGTATASTFVIDNELAEKLDKYAWGHRLSKSEVVEEALRLFFKKNPPPRVTVTTPKKRRRR